MITFGTNPGMGFRSPPPCPTRQTSLTRWSGRRWRRRSVTWTFPPASHCWDIRSASVFIGSCTNSRILTCAAAAALKGRKVHPTVRMMVVPGSQQVKAQAIAEGLDRIFRDAGADFREAGCSMCIAVNGDQVGPASTASRPAIVISRGGGARRRTFLASPLTAVATAVAGAVADARTLL